MSHLPGHESFSRARVGEKRCGSHVRLPGTVAILARVAFAAAATVSRLQIKAVLLWTCSDPAVRRCALPTNCVFATRVAEIDRQVDTVTGAFTRQRAVTYHLKRPATSDESAMRKPADPNASGATSSGKCQKLSTGEANYTVITIQCSTSIQSHSTTKDLCLFDDCIEHEAVISAV